MRGRGIGAMRDDVSLCIIIGDKVVQLPSIRVGHLKTVFLHHRHDVVVDTHKSIGEDVANLRFADLELTELVEIDLVDRATGCDESNEHMCD